MILNEEIFGKLPDRPLHLSVGAASVNEQFKEGRFTLKKLQMKLEFANGITTLHFTAVIPNTSVTCPAVIILTDKASTEDAVAWANNGYAAFILDCKDISANNGNFKDGISAYISPTRRKKSSAGKIAVWTWAAIRAFEYAEALENVDKDNIGIVGDGMLGLSAILAKEVNSGFSFLSVAHTPELNKEFILSYPHLFSPNCCKIALFDNFC